MVEATPNAGDWVLYRDSYDKVRVRLQRVEKVTPHLVKFTGKFHPRQCSRVSVVASFADEETAKLVQQSIDGVDGEFQRRRRAAEDERSRRITEALTAAGRQVEAIISKARPC